MIKGKQPEEIRKLFNIQNDFTPEEEAQIRRENVRVRRWLTAGMGRRPLASVFASRPPIAALRHRGRRRSGGAGARRVVTWKYALDL